MRLRRLALRTSVVLFGLSLLLPAIRTTGGNIVGLVPFLFGGLSFWDVTEPKWTGFSWLANVLVVPTLATGWFPELQRLLALVTLGVACLFFGVDQIVANEAGTMTGAAPGPGYFVWLASCLALNVFAWAPQPDPPDDGTEH